MQVKYRLLAAAFLAASAWAALWFTAAAGLVAAPWYLHGPAGEIPGNYARLYLYDGSPYDRIVIEVHGEQGTEPSAYALEHLQSIVHRYTGKPVDLCVFNDITPDMLPESADNANVSAFCNSFLRQHASCRTGWLGGNVSMYVLYLDNSASRPKANNSGVVAGMSFRADAFVIYDNHISGEGIERTVLVHEAGHLLGLEHDDDPGCAMVGTLVENMSIRTGMALPPDDYCSKDRLQLERMRQYIV